MKKNEKAIIAGAGAVLAYLYLVFALLMTCLRVLFFYCVF